MKYQFFSIQAVGSSEAQEEFNRFCSSHRVINIDKHFVNDAGNSFWAICVSYLDGETGISQNRKKTKVDYREILSPEEFAVYLKLRDLRKNLGEEEGVPLYQIFTNDQLATMVQKRIATKTALAELDGVGSARIEKFADAFLELLAVELPTEKPE
jgi:superfamily II DNA helicase RecQ